MLLNCDTENTITGRVFGLLIKRVLSFLSALYFESRQSKVSFLCALTVNRYLEQQYQQKQAFPFSFAAVNDFTCKLRLRDCVIKQTVVKNCMSQIQFVQEKANNHCSFSAFEHFTYHVVTVCNICALAGIQYRSKTIKQTLGSVIRVRAFEVLLQSLSVPDIS